MAELILLKSNWAAQNHDILPLSFLLPLGWLKKFGPLGPNFLSRLPLSLPAPSGVAQEVWPSRAKLLEPLSTSPSRLLFCLYLLIMFSLIKVRLRMGIL